MMERRGPFQLRLAVLANAPRLARIHRQARITAMPWLPVLHAAKKLSPG
jgi:hypothetical protein